MSIISDTQLMSGISVQQSYASNSVSGFNVESKRAATSTDLQDTVEISSEAYELYSSQGTAASAEGVMETAKETETSESASGAACTESSSGNDSIETQIEELKEEIARVEEEIAALKEKAEDDDVAAEQLQGKQAELMELEAALTELLSEQVDAAS